jgi:alkaline phosphatase
MHSSTKLLRAAAGAALSLSALPLAAQTAQPETGIKNVILFVGDGMGVSTVTATRIFSVGVDGKLALDQLPFTALSRTYSTDAITADSAPTMTAMVSGINTNNDVIGLDATTEPHDFNGDGDGAPTTTILELAKAAGKRVGVVSSARITHATPAACYAHINNRDLENAIALQSLPGDVTYNPMLLSGIDLLAGGGRRQYVPNTVIDEEGDKGSRTDGRDLRAEYQAQGYTYVWDETGWNGLGAADLPVLALFESSHMEYEYDRPLDLGGEPSLEDVTTRAIDLLSSSPEGYFLMVEAGRIDHAHHAGNAWRALVDTEELDQAIAAALEQVDLGNTLIIVSADHSHVFNLAGYPMRPPSELPYTPTSTPAGYGADAYGNLFDVVYHIDPSTGAVAEAGDAQGVPYTALVYGNGPGYRGAPRVSPLLDPFPGLDGLIPSGPEDPDYLQEAAVPLASETHAGEEVAVYAIGRGARRIHGTIKNTGIFVAMKTAFGF